MNQLFILPCFRDNPKKIDLKTHNRCVMHGWIGILYKDVEQIEYRQEY